MYGLTGFELLWLFGVITSLMMIAWGEKLIKLQIGDKII